MEEPLQILQILEKRTEIQIGSAKPIINKEAQCKCYIQN